MPRHNSKPDQFGARFRFNSGFHDGANECRMNHVRSVSDIACYDLPGIQYYAAGYQAGLDAEHAKTYTNNSDPAWQEYLRTLSAAQIETIRIGEYEANLATHGSIRKIQREFPNTWQDIIKDAATRAQETVTLR